MSFRDTVRQEAERKIDARAADAGDLKPEWLGALYARIARHPDLDRARAGRLLDLAGALGAVDRAMDHQDEEGG